MRSWKFAGVLLLGGAFAGLLFLTELVPGALNRQTESIELGALLCLSGVCAEWGQNAARGAQLAIEELNQQGGVLGSKVVLRIEDTDEASSPANTLRAFRKLTQANISLFIGPSWTPGSLALAPVAARQEVVITSPSVGVGQFHQAAPQFFNTWPSDAEATRAVARYAYSQGWRRAGVFSSDQSWEQLQGEVFAEEFVRLGGSIVAHVEPLSGSVSLKAEALRIISARPELVFYSNLSALGVAVKEIAKLGFSGAQFATLVDKTQLNAGKGFLENIVFARYAGAKTWFKKAFIKRFGEEPGVSADTAYDTVRLYVEAIKLAGTSSPSKIREKLNELQLDGASGFLKFDSLGGVQRVPQLFRIEAGQAKSLRRND